MVDILTLGSFVEKIASMDSVHFAPTAPSFQVSTPFEWLVKRGHLQAGVDHPTPNYHILCNDKKNLDFHLSTSSQSWHPVDASPKALSQAYCLLLCPHLLVERPVASSHQQGVPFEPLLGSGSD